MDKDYYDYDYEAVKPKSTFKTKPKSQREVSSMLSRFGFSTKLNGSDKKPLTAEELQAEVMREEAEKKNKR